MAPAARQRRPAADAGRARACPQADLAATQPEGATYRVTWVDIDDPAPTFPYTPGQTARRRRTTTPSATSATRAGRRGRPGSPASRAASTTAASSTSARPRAAGPAEPGSTATPCRGGATASGRSGRTTRSRRGCGSSSSRPVPRCSTSPTTSRPAAAGTLVLCEDSTGDNYLRGLTRHGELFDIALNRLVSSTGTPRFGDEFAGVDVQPRRRARCSSTSRPAGA